MDTITLIRDTMLEVEPKTHCSASGQLGIPVLNVNHSHRLAYKFAKAYRFAQRGEGRYLLVGDVFAYLFIQPVFISLANVNIT